MLVHSSITRIREFFRSKEAIVAHMLVEIFLDAICYAIGLLLSSEQVVQNVSKDSVILLGEDHEVWSMSAVENAEHMARSRYAMKF